MTSCPKCNARIKNDNKFCPECGAKIMVSHIKDGLQEPNNAMRTLKIGAVLLGLIVIIHISSANNISNNSTNDFLAKTSSCKDVQIPYEAQEEYMITEYYNESVPYTDKKCESKKLMYEVRSFTTDRRDCNVIQSDCLNFNEIGLCTGKIDYCIKRYVACTLQIDNKDVERGYWTVVFNISNEDSSETSGTFNKTNWINSGESRSFVGGVDITKKEGVNVIYVCNYNITQEPSKEICRDVIKYSNLMKERKITAYRNVTKYKTEQKCD